MADTTQNPWNVSQVAQPNLLGQSAPTVGQNYLGHTFQGLPSGYNLYPIQSYTDPQTGVTSAGGYLYGVGNDPLNYKYSSKLYPYMVSSQSNPGGYADGVGVGPTSYDGKTAYDPMGHWNASQPAVAQSTQTVQPQQQGMTFGSKFIPGNFQNGYGTPFIQQQPSWSNINQTTPGLGTFTPYTPNQTALQNLNQGQ